MWLSAHLIFKFRFLILNFNFSLSSMQIYIDVFWSICVGFRVVQDSAGLKANLRDLKAEAKFLNLVFICLNLSKYIINIIF